MQSVLFSIKETSFCISSSLRLRSVISITVPTYSSGPANSSTAGPPLLWSIFDRSVRQHDAELAVEVRPLANCSVDGAPDALPVVRMEPAQGKFIRRVQLIGGEPKYPPVFIRKAHSVRRDVPHPISHVTETLGFLQMRLRLSRLVQRGLQPFLGAFGFRDVHRGADIPQLPGHVLFRMNGAVQMLDPTIRHHQPMLEIENCSRRAECPP